MTSKARTGSSLVGITRKSGQTRLLNTSLSIASIVSRAPWTTTGFCRLPTRRSVMSGTSFTCSKWLWVRKVRGNLQAKRHAPPARAGGGAVVQGGHVHERKDEMEWRSVDRRAAARCKPCLGFDRGEPELPRRERRFQSQQWRGRRSRQRLQDRGL